jgi:hypothetical protein
MKQLPAYLFKSLIVLLMHSIEILIWENAIGVLVPLLATKTVVLQNIFMVPSTAQVLRLFLSFVTENIG